MSNNSLARLPQGVRYKMNGSSDRKIKRNCPLYFIMEKGVVGSRVLTCLGNDNLMLTKAKEMPGVINI